MIVVDTNIITHFLLPSDLSAPCVRVHEIDSHWIAPSLWLSEFRNVLALYVRKKIITHDKALELLDFAEDIFRDNTFDVSSRVVMRLSRQSSCSAYDLEFVGLALEMDVRLVTLDKQILREYPNVAIKPEDFI
jgi:predicted nucleic acid-binding protein